MPPSAPPTPKSPLTNFPHLSRPSDHDENNTYQASKHAPATYQLPLDQRRREMWGCLENNTKGAATNNPKRIDYCRTRLAMNAAGTQHISLSRANTLRPIDDVILSERAPQGPVEAGVAALVFGLSFESRIGAGSQSHSLIPETQFQYSQDHHLSLVVPEPCFLPLRNT